MGETKVLGYLFGSYSDDSEKEYTIDWSDDYYEDLKPRTNKMYVYRVSSFNGHYYTTDEKSEAFKLKPGRVYLYDANTNEITDTGEKTEKIEKPGVFSGSGCGGVTGIHSLKKINGESLPYTQSGSLSVVTSGKITFNSDDTWESELKFHNSSTGEQAETIRDGSYDCDGGSGSMMNSNNQASGSYSLSGGVLTLIDGQSTLEYE